MNRVVHREKSVCRYQQQRLVSFSRMESKMEPSYVYIFVRQDLSKEQQLVQAAHVTLVLGNKLKHKNVENLYFTVIGIPQLSDFCKVMKDLKKHGTEYVTFYEPDQGSTLTAIATMPILKSERRNLLEYKLLRFS